MTLSKAARAAAMRNRRGPCRTELYHVHEDPADDRDDLVLTSELAELMADPDLIYDLEDACRSRSGATSAAVR